MIADILLYIAFISGLCLAIWGLCDIWESVIAPALKRRRAVRGAQNRSSLQLMLDEYIKPGIKAEVQAEVDRALSIEVLQEIYKQLGYRPGVSFFTLDGRRNFPPAFSVDERVNAMAEHLGMVFNKTDAQPAKVVLRKKTKEDELGGVVTYRKKSLKVKVGGGK